ncbi:CRISPR-associated protein Cas2 [Cetobacterium ceti]|uniref:CRISPR-associated endoribonuclease Cas2 n=1 Tax=Cetobacterium ceti TaxID=180163 RepID=A0A1T4MAU0_9FUSO|nr:CRISPR-associated endonuclease Cas2 [Cetobacterium ceti]SJZ63991.1 CRISPR-associated protein Cas2 [Cetobacterium ceti]
MYIILVYDISLENEQGARVLNRIFKICKRYLTHIQNSVFEGELTPVLMEKLKIELKEFIRKNIDSVIIFEIPQNKKLKKHFWGKIDEKTSNFF